VVRAADYGVVANGVTDDAPALRSAIEALKNGSALLLPPGLIALGSPGWTGISFEGLSDVVIQGGGSILKWLVAPAQATGPFGPTGLRLKNCVRFHVADFSIDGNQVACIGLGLEECESGWVSHVEAFRHGATSIGGLGQFASCRGKHNRWQGCVARDSTPGSQFRGFYLGNANSGWGESDLHIDGCTAARNDATGFALAAVRMTCNGSTATDNGGAGFISATSPGSASTDHVFTGNVARGNAFHGWQTDVYGPNAERIILVGNTFCDNGFAGVLCHRAIDVSISGNVINGNGPRTGVGAVVLSMSRQVVVSGNLISGDGAHGVCINGALARNRLSEIVITNNQCNGTVSKVIWLESLDGECVLARIVCSNNIVRGGSHGIYLATSAAGAVLEHISVSGNLIGGATVADFSLSDYAPGQSSNVRVVENSARTAVINPSAAPAADAGNSWNAAVTEGPAPPRSGHWMRGSRIYNAAPASGTAIGWVCVESGEPGSWRSFGAIHDN
jgi:hypothetical protein